LRVNSHGWRVNEPEKQPMKDQNETLIERNVFYSRDPKQSPTYDGRPRGDGLVPP